MVDKKWFSKIEKGNLFSLINNIQTTPLALVPMYIQFLWSYAKHAVNRIQKNPQQENIEDKKNIKIY